MAKQKINEIEIDRCSRCGGVWLDALEKDRLITARSGSKAEATSKMQDVPRPKAMHCPKDNSRLIKMVDLNQPHVGFESCKTCGGMFFDSGELKDLNHTSFSEWLKSIINLH